MSLKEMPSPPGEPRVFEIEELGDFMEFLKDHRAENSLFRGQEKDWPLIPKAGRLRPRKGTQVDAEKQMLEDFKRMAIAYLQLEPRNEWEWFAVAQHYGMATRFLDWTRNPLAALWFAVRNPPGDPKPGVGWMFCPSDDSFLRDPRGEQGILNTDKWRVFEPPHMSVRFQAQSAVLISHQYNNQSKYLILEQHGEFKSSLTKVMIPAQQFKVIRRQLNSCGINQASLFPDLDGLATHINWLHSLAADETDMIHILRTRATAQELADMLSALGVYVKLAVDIQRGILAGGGALHADCEAVLLADGSQQQDVWGADWIPSTQQVRYEALINIRPRQNNPALTILDPTIRDRVGKIVRDLLGGV
jgi:hypothetical protein